MKPSRDNPFATRRTRPGEIPFFFTGDESIARLVGRLKDHNWWGEITGPHGSGKSTLLAHLLPALKHDAGHRLLHLGLHDGQRRLPFGWTRRAGDASLIVVDGFEQLGWLSRWWLKRFCRRHGRGLLVTAHASVGLPPLYRTRTDLELAHRVVQHLLKDEQPPSEHELSQLFTAHHGDLREMLFALYDEYESSP